MIDESGSCSASNTITVSRAGSDTINGGTSALLNSAYAFVGLESDGVSKWTVIGPVAQAQFNALAAAWASGLPTSLPGSAGIPWLNGYIVQVA